MTRYPSSQQVFRDAVNDTNIIKLSYVSISTCQELTPQV